MAALNCTVVRLHRVAFGGIRLHPLEGPGDWEYLDEKEMKIVQSLLEQSENEDINKQNGSEDYFADDE